MLYGADASAQDVLGTEVRPGDLRRQFEQAFQSGPAVTAPGWTTQTSIDIAEAYASPVTTLQQRPGVRANSDFYTAIAPALSITGAGARVQGSLFWTPTLRVYAQTGNQNSFSNNFNGQARATIIEDTAFLDVTGASQLASRTGGFQTAATQSRNDTYQTTSFSARPSLRHQFKDYGTAEVSYSVQQTMNDLQGRTVTTSPFAPPVASGSSTTTDARGSFTSGEYFGRYAAALKLDASKTTGDASVASSQNTATIESSYRYSREWTILASIGWEDIRYSGLNPRRINDATWYGGATWTPNPDSEVTVRYGRQQGGTNVSIDASYAPTPRIRLGLVRTDVVSTGQQAYQNAIASAQLNALGQYIDPRTGIPLGATNSYFGSQGASAYRTVTTTFTASYLNDRNIFSASVAQTDRSLFSAANGPGPAPPGATSGITESLSAQRSLNPDLSGSAYVELGQRKGTTGTTVPSNEDSLSLGANLTYAFSETLAGRVQYSFTSTSSNTPGLNQTQHLILVGLHKSF